MSNLLSTNAMVAECQRRVPIGLDSTFWMRKLNEAYRWISQKGNFVWDVKAFFVTVNQGQNVFDIPSDCDPGKPMYLAGPTSAIIGGTNGIGVLNSVIPYKPWDETLDQQYSELTAMVGAFSCWTFYTNFTAGPPTLYAYKGILYPLSAAPNGTTGAYNFTFAYHTDVSSAELAAANNVYFPTPNSFDNLMIELAEAETRRIYGLAGWDIIQKRAESAIVNLLDSYRSTKNVLAGLVDQQKQANEKKLMAMERG